MKYDYHMHSHFSPDGRSSMEEMIQESIRLGLKEICFTDHVEHDTPPSNETTVDYVEYFKALTHYQQKYVDQIVIKKGIEMGIQEHVLPVCSEDICGNPFDFVLGSFHSIDRLDLYYGKFQEGKTANEAYETYFQRIYELIKKYNDYSCLAHLDLIKRYNYYDQILNDEPFHDIIEAILKHLIENGKGIEVNTSSFRYNVPDLIPSTYILKLYKELGGEILTMGSDAHDTTQLAHRFDEVGERLRAIGYKYVCTFNQMKPDFVKL